MTPTTAAPANDWTARLKRYASFAISGGVGFTVDVGMLNVLAVGFGMNAYLARVIAIGCAMMATWQINRRVTFRDRVKRGSARDLASEGGRYIAVALVSAVVNWGVYAATIRAVPVVAPWLGNALGELLPTFGAVVGSGVAMLVSYYGYSRFAFRPH
jgi:putative flippase GtrA